jgi:hypothetical protein
MCILPGSTPVCPFEQLIHEFIVWVWVWVWVCTCWVTESGWGRQLWSATPCELRVQKVATGARVFVCVCRTNNVEGIAYSWRERTEAENACNSVPVP